MQKMKHISSNNSELLAHYLIFCMVLETNGQKRPEGFHVLDKLVT